MQQTPRIVITPGEPGGIGPDLILGLAAQGWPVELVIVADPQLLAERAAQLNLKVQLLAYDPHAEARPQQQGTLTVAAIPLA